MNVVGPKTDARTVVLALSVKGAEALRLGLSSLPDPDEIVVAAIAELDDQLARAPRKP